MQNRFRGADVISWVEQEPDFQVRPLNVLLPRLRFSTAASLWSRSGARLLILVDQAVRDQIERHLATRRIEQGGLLLGSAYRASPGASTVVTVEDAVAAADALGTGVSLTMASQVWEDARARSTAQRTVIGWYHSHPDLGAFFSGTDRHTQRAFFGNAHSIGLVSDPVRKEERWFSGPESVEVPAGDRLLLS